MTYILDEWWFTEVGWTDKCSTAPFAELELVNDAQVYLTCHIDTGYQNSSFIETGLTGESTDYAGNAIIDGHDMETSILPEDVVMYPGYYISN